MAESNPDKPDTTPAPPSAEPPRGDWAKSTMWMVIVLIVTLNGFLLIRSCSKAPGDVIDKTTKLVEKAGKALSDVASAFNQGRVTTEFISYATTVTPTRRLQFATLKQKEIFTRREEGSTAFGYVPLPEVIVEARAPIEFTYYLDLNAPWRLVLEDQTIYVLAPAIHFNTPAIDVSGMQFEVKKDKFFSKTAAAMESLRQSMTILAKDRARENISLVRENGRKETTGFVEEWVAKSFTDGRKYPVKVFFPDEKLPLPLARGSTNVFAPLETPR
jgi:hypothetical protein